MAKHAKDKHSLSNSWKHFTADMH